MRYALLMHYREPGEGEISEEAIKAAMEAFGAYGRALESAGVLLSADVLQPSAATTTVTWTGTGPSARGASLPTSSECSLASAKVVGSGATAFAEAAAGLAGGASFAAAAGFARSLSE